MSDARFPDDLSRAAVLLADQVTRLVEQYRTGEISAIETVHLIEFRGHLDAYRAARDAANG